MFYRRSKLNKNKKEKMNRMKNTLMSIVACVFIAGFTNNVVAGSDDKEHCHSHKCDDKCNKDKNKHNNDHKCDKYHCNDRCKVFVTNVVEVVRVRVVTNIVDVVNNINLTNRFFTTNMVYITETITNYITATNMMHCPVNDLAISDYNLNKSHTYRLYVATDTKKWTHWGTIRAGSNFTARLIIPLASIRPLYWQVVDFTPGYPRVAIEANEPTAENAVSYIALIRGRLYRIPDNARP